MLPASVAGNRSTQTWQRTSSRCQPVQAASCQSLHGSSGAASTQGSLGQKLACVREVGVSCREVAFEVPAGDVLKPVGQSRVALQPRHCRVSASLMS